MNITKKIEGGKVTILLEGWLDTVAAPKLNEAVSELGEAEELIFDFEKVDYISSSGLREVVVAFKKQMAANHAFSIINVNEDVKSIFKLTKIDTKIKILSK